MTLTDRQTLHTQFLRWHRQQELMARRLVLARMNYMLVTLSDSLTRGNVQTTLGLLSLYVSTQSHQLLLETIYAQIGTLAARKEYDRLVPPTKANALQMQTKDRETPGADDKPRFPNLLRVDFHSEQWRQKMIALARSSETLKRVGKMTEQTRKLVRGVLVEGAGHNWAISKVIAKIRGVLLDKTRATLIARTETTRAANAGHELGAQSTLLVLNKVWIATADTRTRPTHLAMLSMKPIPRDDKFLVGGLPMNYPGDPAGGAAECANCRCTVSYIPANVNYD